MGAGLRLRAATPADLALLRRWDEQPHVVTSGPHDANTRAHRFYERLGFRFVERRRFGRDDCFVYRLDRAGYAPTARRPGDADAGRQCG